MAAVFEQKITLCGVQNQWVDATLVQTALWTTATNAPADAAVGLNLRLLIQD
jgi:hypothetical protein